MNVTKIEITNFLGYRQETFDFTDMSGVILITGINDESGSEKESNGAGKSSIFDALMWSLFGRTRNVFDKELVKDDVIHIIEGEKRAERCKVMVQFEMNNNEYRVTRSRKLGGNTSLQIFIKSGKKWKDLSLSAGVNKRTGKRETAINRTQHRIDDTINCNCDLFHNSVLCEQGNTNTFARSSKTEREDLFKIALFLQKWHDYAQSCKDRLKIVKEKISNKFAVLDDVGEISEIEEQLKSTKKEIANLTMTIRSLKTKLKKSKAKIKKTQKEVNELEVELGKYADIEEKIEAIDKEIEDLETVIENENGKLDFARRQYKKENEKKTTRKIDYDYCVRNIKELKATIPEVDVSKMRKLDKEKMELVGQISKNTAQLSRLREDRENVAVVKCDHDDCPFGTEERKKQRIKEIDDEIKKYVAKNNAIEKKKKVIEKSIEECEEDLEQKEDVEKTIEKVIKKRDEYKDGLQRCEIQIEKFKTQIDSYLKSITAYEKDIQKRRQKRSDMADHITAANGLMDRYGAASDVLREEEEHCGDITRKLGDSAAQKRGLDVSRDHLSDQFSKVSDLKKEVISLEEDKNVIDFSIDLLSKDIPHVLIENAIPEIQDNTNSFLDKLSNGRMSIEFQTEKTLKHKDADGEYVKSDAMDLMLTLDNKTYKYALYSGGEKNRADFAIHIGYAVFLLQRSGHQLETLFLDEVCSALDDEGRETLVDLLHELHMDFGFKKIFLISQDYRLKKMIDQQISIIKTSEGSKIRCLS